MARHGDPARGTNTHGFRQFSCPGCGTLIENEVAIASDPVLKDIELHPSALQK